MAGDLMNLDLLYKAKNGDMEARNLFLESNKPYVHKFACLICKRYLSWQNDDELSIAFLAFNSAIDSFNEGDFKSYSKIVIKSRLIDYFRKAKNLEVPIDDEIVENYAYYTPSIDEKLDRISQINLFKNLLSDFKITLQDLTSKSPKHKDTRQKLIDVAMSVCDVEEITGKMMSQKILPIKEIMIISDISRKTLEEWRKYIISLIIIFSDKRLDSIKDFIV
jgi:RNA polymerase sigma factor